MDNLRINKQILICNKHIKNLDKMEADMLFTNQSGLQCITLLL